MDTIVHYYQTSQYLIYRSVYHCNQSLNFLDVFVLLDDNFWLLRFSDLLLNLGNLIHIFNCSFIDEMEILKS